MAQVPYQPVPSVRPTEHGPRPISVSTPVGAFGGAVAQALEGLGKGIEGAGNELFQRATAFQELHNETEARQASTNMMEEQAIAQAKYDSLEGQAATDGLQDHLKNLKSIGQKHRDTLSNPSAQRMFDGEAASSLRQTILRSAGHAGQQQKSWSHKTLNAEDDLTLNQIYNNPKDEGLWQQGMSKLRRSAAERNSLEGGGEDSAQLQDSIAKSERTAWAHRITGLAKTDPWAAKTMLEENRGKLGVLGDKVEDTVQTQGRIIGSANIANSIYEAGRGDDTKPAKSLSEMEDEAKAKAKQLNPNDPILADHTVKTLQGLYNQDKYARRQEEIANTQTVDEAIQRGVKNEQELRADPKIAAALAALPKDKQLSVPARINSYNAARDKADNEDNYRRLIGMSSNNVEAFLNTDMTKEPLSKGEMDRMMGLQKQLKKNPYQDPRVNRAMSDMRTAHGAELEALGIFRRTEQNKDQFDHYTGALQSAIDVWAETHGKPPNYKDLVDTIGPQVIKQRTEPGFFGMMFGGVKKPAFEREVPEEFSKQIKSDIVGRGGTEPTDEEVYKAYVRKQFIDLYSKPLKAPGLGG